MKAIKKPLIAAAALDLLAQDATPPGREGGPRRQAPALVTALDANQEGVIDASEIANASKASLTLEKNRDGQLNADELRPEKASGDRGPAGPDGRRRPRTPQDEQ